MSFSFVRTRYWWFALSGALIVASIAAIAVFGLKLSIDFTGGSLMEMRFADPQPSTTAVAQTLEKAGFPGAVVQTTGQGTQMIRLESLDETKHQAALKALGAAYPKAQEEQFNSIGPVVGSELRNTSVVAVVVTLVLIGLYIAWAFRKVTHPVSSWKYGALVVVTAAHDVIIPLGVFAVISRTQGWEVGTAFVAAVLTILGYSISDTVVVFDRTRENLSHRTGEPFAEVVDQSIRQTFVRSVNTSVATMLVLLAILVFGGPTTAPFALALFIGVLVGTYSSIFIASPLLVEWERRQR